MVRCEQLESGPAAVTHCINCCRSCRLSVYLQHWLPEGTRADKYSVEGFLLKPSLAILEIRLGENIQICTLSACGLAKCARKAKILCPGMRKTYSERAACSRQPVGRIVPALSRICSGSVYESSRVELDLKASSGANLLSGRRHRAAHPASGI